MADAEGRAAFDVVNPATREVVAQIANAGLPETRLAIDAAPAAHDKTAAPVAPALVSDVAGGKWPKGRHHERGSSTEIIYRAATSEVDDARGD